MYIYKYRQSFKNGKAPREVIVKDRTTALCLALKQAETYSSEDTKLEIDKIDNGVTYKWVIRDKVTNVIYSTITLTKIHLNELTPEDYCFSKGLINLAEQFTFNE